VLSPDVGCTDFCFTKGDVMNSFILKSLLFLTIFLSSANLFADITTCPGDKIDALDGVTTTTTVSGNNFSIEGNSTHYFYFTPATTGYIRVEGHMNKSYNSLYIKEDCSNILWSDTTNSKSKSSTNILVNSGTRIVIAYERRWSTSAYYDLTITFTTIPINAADDSFTLSSNTALSDNVISNDNGYNITVTSNTNPSHGSVTINSDGSFTYTPDTDYEGTDSFTYTITDANGQTDSATVNLNITNLVTHGDFVDFSKRLSLFEQGEMVSIGNTFVVHPTPYWSNTCNSYTTGSYTDPVLTNNSEQYYCQYNVDGVQGTAATRAELIIPEGSSIVWAGLYWQALTPHKSSYDNLTIDIRRDENGTNYQTVSANEVNYQSSYSTNIAPVGSSTGATSADIYSAFADVTSLFQDQGWVDGNYTVRTADVMEGRETYFGVYGAWNLIVIYKNKNSSYKSFTIFDGWKQVQCEAWNYNQCTQPGDVKINVSGFYTPKSTPIKAQIAVFAAEGDYNINGDKLKAIRQSDSSTVEFLNSNNPSYTNQTFSAYVHTTGSRTPSQRNNNGIDIQSFDIGSDTTYNLLQPQQSSMEFHFTSTRDLYFPSVIAFSTEIYTPKMCYDFSVKQDGSYLQLNRDAYSLPIIDDYISSSDVEVTVYLKSKEADFIAKNIALKSDVNNSIFTTSTSDSVFVSNVNGSTLIDRGTPNSVGSLPIYNTTDDYSITNTAQTDGHNILKGIGNLDSQQYIYAKFKLHPNGIIGLSDINTSLGLSASFYISLSDGSKIDYKDYLLGSDNIPLCPPSDSYVPEWGQFNVVKSGQPEDNIINNIRTQISRKPFNASVVFDATPTTGDDSAPSGNINTTVLVQIIDMDAFGDINASCANPDSALTAPIFLQTNFSTTNHQTLITPQTLDYYNFAVKNAAFRVWYFTDSNGTLIQNWNATTTNAGKTLTGINGLYDPAVHTACSTPCDSDANSASCFTCIFQNYAKPLCSRDNFSVRPESYDVRIYDNNQSSSISAPKNSLSVYYGYDTSSSTTPTNKMQLAAGYDYRFDINSTGHNDTTATPGYTRYFNGFSDYNATLLWDNASLSNVTCNDISNQNIKFYIRNGEMTNQERHNDNIGAYKLNIIDTSWTAVDWDSNRLTHHTTANAFTSGTDCITGSNSATLSSGEYGCYISTNHGSDGNGHYYRDTNIQFHPYSFDLNGTLAATTPITSTVGLNFVPLSTNAYVYYADINNSNDENMSYHINGSITAMAKNNSATTNFVNGCYAVPLTLTITTSDRTLKDVNNNNIAYIARFHDLNASGDINTSLDINYSNTATPMSNIVFNTVQTSTKGYFQKTLNGVSNTRLNMNYKRNMNVTINPKSLTFSSYKVTCTNATGDCTFSAGMEHNKTTKGIKDLNATIQIKHYYGRAHAGKQRYGVPTDAPYNANIYYEIYCYGAGCDTTLLPSTKHVDDIRWYQNTLHSTSNDGNATNVFETDGIGKVTRNGAINNTLNPTTVNLLYDGSLGYPYTTTMDINASGWLIYNENNNPANPNPFQVEFNKAVTGWSGEKETNTTTKSTNVSKTNRRTMW
jgi:hypothetical protein